MTRRIHVATIGAPHGVRGEVRVKPLTDDPLALKKYGPLESEDGKRTFSILSARMQGEMAIVKFDGITDRDVAATLTHTKLYVPRERLPEPKAGEYYASDLVGLRVEDESGVEIGSVLGVVNFGAGDLIEISRAGRDSVHIPFFENFVPKIDLDGGRIVITPPDGLLDDNAVNNDEEPG
jgi:16S rRNA processing protein RimM